MAISFHKTVSEMLLILIFSISAEALGADIQSSRISVGIAHACTVGSDDKVRCWGNNDYGQLGDGTKTGSANAVIVKDLSNVISVASGVAHSCVLQQDGRVMCWGSNLEGSLGTGSFEITESLRPLKVQGISKAKQIDASWGHTCVVLSEGTIRCWGINNAGQLGDGSKTTSPNPVQAKGVTDAISVAAGIAHTCALIADGTVKCWGTDGFGLSRGIAVNSPNPTTINGISSAVAIAVGRNFSCAVLDNGRVKCWGSDILGQLGNAQASGLSPSPVTVSGITTAKAVSAGLFHACALLADGGVSCWGAYFPRHSQGFDAIPVTVDGVPHAAEIAAGGSSACAILEHNQVLCWGGNRNGQLGNRRKIDSEIPVRVERLGD